MKPRTKTKVAMHPIDNSSHPACSASESDISGSVCCDSHTLRREKPTLVKNTTQNARILDRLALGMEVYGMASAADGHISMCGQR